MFKKISDRCSGRANNNTASLSELSSFKRTNGFTWPPDKAQVFTWIVLVYFGLAIFGSFCVSLAQPYSYVFGLLAAGFYLTHIALNIATMAINPGEEVTLNKKITPKNKFDRDKHKHVIENQFCNICQIVVSEKAKHCRRCNKCITHFDHHCIYLNNCVGSRNYILFILTIASAFFGACVIFVFGIIEFTCSFFTKQTFLTKQYFNQNTTLCNDENCPDIYKAYPIFGPVSVASWRAFIMITSLVALIIAVLIGYLIGYHMFLAVKNLTTYDHTMILKEKSDEKKARQEQEKLRKASITALRGPQNEKFMERMGEDGGGGGGGAHFYQRRSDAPAVAPASPTASHHVSIIHNGVAANSPNLPPLVSYINNESSAAQSKGGRLAASNSTAAPQLKSNDYNYYTNKNESASLDPPYLSRNKSSYVNQTFRNDYDYGVRGSGESETDAAKYNRFDYYNNGIYGAVDDGPGEGGRKKQQQQQQRSTGSVLNPNSLASLRNIESENKNGIPCINDAGTANNGYLFVEGERNAIYDDQTPRFTTVAASNQSHSRVSSAATPSANNTQTSNILYNSRLPPINTVSRKESAAPLPSKSGHRSRIVGTNQVLSDASELNDSKTFRKSSLSNSRSRNTMNEVEDDDLVLSLKASRALRRGSVDSRNNVKF